MLTLEGIACEDRASVPVAREAVRVLDAAVSDMAGARTGRVTWAHLVADVDPGGGVSSFGAAAFQARPAYRRCAG